MSVSDKTSYFNNLMKYQKTERSCCPPKKCLCTKYNRDFYTQHIICKSKIKPYKYEIINFFVLYMQNDVIK